MMRKELRRVFEVCRDKKKERERERE